MRIEEPSARSFEALAAHPDAIPPERVAREFEALLLSEVWKRAQKPLGFSRTLAGGSAGQMYRELFVEEVARRVALERGIGVAESLAERLRPESASVREEPGDG